MLNHRRFVVEICCQEDVKKSISLKFRLNGNVCRRPSGRLQAILARFFSGPKLLHVSKSIFSHLPDETGTLLDVLVSDFDDIRAGIFRIILLLKQP